MNTFPCKTFQISFLSNYKLCTNLICSDGFPRWLVRPRNNSPKCAFNIHQMLSTQTFPLPVGFVWAIVKAELGMQRANCAGRHSGMILWGMSEVQGYMYCACAALRHRSDKSESFAPPPKAKVWTIFLLLCNCERAENHLRGLLYGMDVEYSTYNPCQE